MSNPYADTPLWARYYSEQMGWLVTRGVLDAADGPVRCDYCGATETGDLGDWDSALKRWVPIRRPMALERDYCFGCGALICERCEKRSRVQMGPHDQSGHLPAKDVA